MESYATSSILVSSQRSVSPPPSPYMSSGPSSYQYGNELSSARTSEGVAEIHRDMFKQDASSNKGYDNLDGNGQRRISIGDDDEKRRIDQLIYVG